MKAKKKTANNVAKVVKRPHQMSLASPQKKRLVISCTEEEKMFVKMLAVKNCMSMSEYLLLPAHKAMSKTCAHHCMKSHVPNEETARVLRDLDAGGELQDHETLDDFWKSLGLDKYA
jgi:hypothetical protein